MKSILKGFLHLFISTTATALVMHATSGQALTSGNVLIPSLTAGALAVGHAAWPSIIGLPPADPPPTTGSFPTTR